MIDRRTLTTPLVGGIVAPRASLAEDTGARDVFYARQITVTAHLISRSAGARYGR
jgi:hypothetical protein